ncbi:uncharacterized protein STEHIDRAFT_131659 [Stereum hirsutum FP-91666 SS1]|uniref:uncharacterized protein n=1 Tax=Stereum hirsutum (strain FP-91666) TaxID=721885 RepID=UPI0004449F06|nr:uncharacterized protein STEHIDRAFT_131659 [Stereum hirsutum FP-91666 SS1]EIM85979.1 hypothetical protein STEHIDRAFT_131659 [Stereum hirsutum FP-91666 SS1]
MLSGWSQRQSASAASTRAPEVSHRPIFNWDTIKYFYAFGDSYTFVQGTEGLANFSFIGDAFDLSFTPQQLFSNEIIPKNTSSDGANWPEFLTGCTSGLPSRCPRQLWDFAFAGADIDVDLLPLHHNFSVQLVDQVKQWAQYASDVIPHPTGETMTAWFIGINDTGDVGSQNITDFDAFWEAEMTSYFNAVELAYTTGLRGAHLFINVPPEERSPAFVGTSSEATHKQLVDEFNAALNTSVAQFAQNHTELTVLTFDAHSWFNEVLDNAEQFGFTNITGYCECTYDSFFWYNTGHPTERVHKLMADAIRSQLLHASHATD